jgi:hypothetical protein
MGWIWFLFILFSVISSIIEKVAKTQQPQRASRPGKTGEKGRTKPLAPRPVAFPPFFLDEEEDDSEELLLDIPEATKPEIKWAEKETIGLESFGTMGKWEMLVEDEVFDETFDDDILSMELMDEDFGLEKDFVEKDEVRAGIKTGDFYSALLLAQVIARPDFKTIPWKRRL